MEQMLIQDWSGLVSKILIIGGNGYIGTRLYEYLSIDEENMQSDKDIDIIINNILKDDHCISETQLALKRNNIFLYTFF